jgi:hypothetical protein
VNDLKVRTPYDYGVLSYLSRSHRGEKTKKAAIMDNTSQKKNVSKLFQGRNGFHWTTQKHILVSTYVTHFSSNKNKNKDKTRRKYLKHTIDPLTGFLIPLPTTNKLTCHATNQRRSKFLDDDDDPNFT